MKFNIKIIGLAITLLILPTGCKINNEKSDISTDSIESTLSQQEESSSDNKISYRNLDVDELEVIANQGDVNAQVQLGALYDFGDKVERDSQKAIEWYSKAD